MGRLHLQRLGLQQAQQRQPVLADALAHGGQCVARLGWHCVTKRLQLVGPLLQGVHEEGRLRLARRLEPDMQFSAEQNSDLAEGSVFLEEAVVSR